MDPLDYQVVLASHAYQQLGGRRDLPHRPADAAAAERATGATGYETGMGSREALNYRQFAASHRPQQRRGTPTTPPGSDGTSG